jgi:ubiquinone/menaquinone biosynthesis C-methylase UbiE
MTGHVCPWWGGFFIDNPLRRILHKPEKILATYVEPGMTAVDFGCGMGLFSIAMADLVGDQGRVISVDRQQKMLDVVRKRAEKAGLSGRIRTHRCPPDSIALDERAEFILAFWSAHEAPDAGHLLAEFHDCLTDGGRLLVAEPKLHVTRKAFEKTIATAGQTGLKLESKPAIRASWAATFLKS